MVFASMGTKKRKIIGAQPINTVAKMAEVQISAVVLSVLAIVIDL